MVVELSSAWLVRVSDEPGLGTTDYCCTFTAKRRKKERSEAAEGYINTASIARGYDSVLVTYPQRHDFQIEFVFYLFYYKSLCNFVLN